RFGYHCNRGALRARTWRVRGVEVHDISRQFGNAALTNGCGWRAPARFAPTAKTPILFIELSTEDTVNAAGRPALDGDRSHIDVVLADHDPARFDVMPLPTTGPPRGLDLYAFVTLLTSISRVVAAWNQIGPPVMVGILDDRRTPLRHAL